MARGKKHTPEQIITLLRQVEVAVANPKAIVTQLEFAEPPCLAGPIRKKLLLLDRRQCRGSVLDFLALMASRDFRPKRGY
jgi:hypothetical protein